MRTLFLKDSSDRKKQFALTTRICIENEKKIIVKESCFLEGIPHLERIVESQNFFTKYYPNIEINKTWIENDMLYAEFIEGIPLSDLYIKSIQNKDKNKIIELLEYHIKLALGQNNICIFKATDEFVKIFGEVDIFEGKPALTFTFFDPASENIILRRGKNANPCFIDYEWFFDFPIPISLLKFRIAECLSWLPGMNDIISFEDRLKVIDCELSFDEGIIFINKFYDFVYNDESINYLFLNKEYQKNILNYSDIISQNCTLYFDTGNGYSEDEKSVHSFTENEVEISCQVPENTVAVRFDPVEGHGCVISYLELFSHRGKIKYEPINGYKDKNGDMIFTNTDPQIELSGVSCWVKIRYKILILSEYSHYRVLSNYVLNNHVLNNYIDTCQERDGLITERDGLITERDGLITERDGLITERDGLITERDGLITERDGLLNSRSWRITKPLRKFTAFVRRNRVLYPLAKGLLSIKRFGIIKTIKKVVTYGKQRQLSSFETDTLLYESEYQENMDFSGYEPKVKAIAFYLPQFHTIPENDKWWGKGFTEWTNTRKTKSRFKGHYQPREPHRDIGYYNLTKVKTIRKQAMLAKQHGIYGFCFYLYWFSGKRLLEKPLDLFLEHPEIKINFCLCWANENWTRRWDGMDNEVLMRQNYSDDDPYRFIEDIQKYILDSRYIRIDGIPIILVYNPGHIQNVKDVFIKWKAHANEIGIGKIKIWVCKTFGHTAETLYIDDIIDGVVEFPPLSIPSMIAQDIPSYERTGYLYDYEELVSKIKQEFLAGNIACKTDLIPIFRTCMMGWDNSARRENGWCTFVNFSLRRFFEWVSLVVTKAIQTKESIFFINAWNEWAEGTYLEPDKKYGYANINTLSKAVFGFEFDENDSKQSRQGYDSNNKGIIFVGHDAHQNGAQVLALNIIRQLTEIFRYDVYLILKSGGLLINDFDVIAAKTICLDNLGGQNIKAWVQATGVDKAICNTVVSGDILHLLTECGVTCISLVHEMEKVIRQYSCENNLSFIAKDALKIVFASDYVRKSAEKIMPIPKEKVVICPQGLYTTNPYINERANARYSICSKHNILQYSKIVLGVGYGDYRKGLDLFVQCMLKVCKSCEDTYFIWLGNIENNILLKVKNLLKGHEMESRFITIGWEKDPMPYYAAADIYLLTSREDPFPSVVLEAMYSYLPVIAFENGGGYVEIIDNNTGGLVPMEDVYSMSEHAVQLLNNDELRLRIGKYAHSLIEDKFNFAAYIYYLSKLLGTDYKKISVIIPNYNYDIYLRKRIESILFQTYPVFEIIILDDCSTDNSLQIIDEYVKRFPLRIKVIENEKNCGNVFKQWTKGIEIAKGDYIWIAEADDLSEPTFLEEVINGMSLDENIVMGYAQSKIIDEDGKNIGDNYLFYTDEIDTIWQDNYIADGKDEIEKRLSIKNTILNVSAVVFNNKKLLEASKNAKSYNVAGDWRLYIDLLRDGGKILFIADNLNIHRRHTNSVTKTLKAHKHFDEICEMQEYIYKITNNSEYFERAKIYREEVKEYLGIKD